MYFPISELHGWGKRFAVQPQTIYSEVPLTVVLRPLVSDSFRSQGPEE